MGNQADISQTIIAKSDQLNAADLVGAGIVVKILDVDVSNDPQQPVTITVDGGRQPYKPCKGMRRLISSLWSTDSSTWVGRSMQLYCDPDVKWAGKKEGGIRISALSHIDKTETVPVRTSRTAVTHYTVTPLSVEKPAWPDSSTKDKANDWTLAFASGKKPSAIIEWIESKYTITESQKDAIRALAPKETDNSGEITAAQLDQMLADADSLESVLDVQEMSLHLASADERADIKGKAEARKLDFQA